MSKQLTLIPNKLWLWIEWGNMSGKYFMVSLQKRIAKPPARQQTKYYKFLIRKSYKGFLTEVI